MICCARTLPSRHGPTALALSGSWPVARSRAVGGCNSRGDPDPVDELVAPGGAPVMPDTIADIR
jgi:hypothetical protein